MMASIAIASFAHATSGIASVGLNAHSVRDADVQIVDEPRPPLGRRDARFELLRERDVRVRGPRC